MKDAKKDDTKPKVIERDTPAYKLEDMQKLAEEHKAVPTYRVARFLNEHYAEDLEELISKVLESLEEKDFIKSVELINRPGTMADVYAGGWYDKTEWYVKAFIEDDKLTLQVWSMCWDGAAH